MTIPTDKPLKKCIYCGKEVANLGLHIINNHPTIMAQIEEKHGLTQSDNLSPKAESVSPQPTITKANLTTKEMIRDKIEQMIDIKILKMLEKDVPLEEINKALNPPQTPQIDQLEQLKKYSELINTIRGNSVPVGQVAESSTDWGQVISQGLNVLPQLLALRTNKNMESENDVEHRTDEKGNNGICELIPEETSRDTGEPINIGEKSNDIGGEDELDDEVARIIN